MFTRVIALKKQIWNIKFTLELDLTKQAGIDSKNICTGNLTLLLNLLGPSSKFFLKKAMGPSLIPCLVGPYSVGSWLRPIVS